MSVIVTGQPLHIKCIVLGSAGCGKTSVLRRAFYNTFEPERSSTVGSDWYTKKVHNPYYNQHPRSTAPLETASRKSKRRSTAHKENQFQQRDKTMDTLKTKKKHVKKLKVNHLNSIREESTEHGSKRFRRSVESQDPVEDVPDEIRFLPSIVLQMWDTAGLERNVSANKTHGLTANFGDNFFRHSDVAVLVYDATSSRSFTQLIQWYSDLLARIKKVRGYSEELKSHQYFHFPVLIIANKFDQLNAETSKPPRQVAPQRDVMGLNHRFKGDNITYEYTVSSGSPASTFHNNFSSDKRTAARRRDGQTQPLSYSLEGASWTTDHSYLDSIITAEDGSFPDRDLVLLWCRRNGLKHIEVSALDGTGINVIMDEVVRLAMDSMIQTKKRQIRPNRYSDDNDEENLMTIDLSERYKAKDECRFFRCFCQVYPGISHLAELLW